MYQAMQNDTITVGALGARRRLGKRERRRHPLKPPHPSRC
jgi:hypothetical protein